MLKVKAKSKKGNQLINRHGDLWVPVRHGNVVSALGGDAGMELKSVKTGKTYWIRDLNDEIFWIVDRVDANGKSLIPEYQRPKQQLPSLPLVPMTSIEADMALNVALHEESKDAPGVLQAA
jgi:hypothetical protein